MATCRSPITCAWRGIFAGLGIKKIRITGGEPLLRKGVVDFVREVARLRDSDGEPLDIAITTNGHLLADMAQPLKDAGLRRVTVSMDAVDPDRFRAHHSSIERIRQCARWNSGIAAGWAVAGESQLRADARLQ